MSNRNQALSIVVLGALGALALLFSWALLGRADTPEDVQAAAAVGAVAPNVVAAIAGFMAGRASASQPPDGG